MRSGGQEVRSGGQDVRRSGGQAVNTTSELVPEFVYLLYHQVNMTIFVLRFVDVLPRSIEVYVDRKCSLFPEHLISLLCGVHGFIHSLYIHVHYMLLHLLSV